MVTHDLCRSVPCIRRRVPRVRRVRSSQSMNERQMTEALTALSAEVVGYEAHTDS